MNFQLKFAYRDLINSLSRVWLFCACLVFGVCLIMAAAGLQQMLNRSLLADTRALMGGDVEIESVGSIDTSIKEWIAQTAELSLTRELNTMISTSGGEFMLVELLSTDDAYPLYGQLTLQPGQRLSEALALRDERWGVAIDPILAERLGLTVNDTVFIGDIELEVRALVLEQPDRQLNASWRGAPVLLSDAALEATELIRPGSRVEYQYRVRTEQNSEQWKQAFVGAFPDTEWEIQTFQDRSERIAERLSKIASGLLIVAFSTLFIGGLGVFNSISVYLQSKRESIATLKACGLQDKRIGHVYLLQIGMLASVSGLIGVLLGSGLAWIGSEILAQELPVTLEFFDIFSAATLAWLFGIVTAYTFALPALGRALNIDVASLFRGSISGSRSASAKWQLASIASAGLLAAIVLITIPNLLFGLAFLLTVSFCLLFFEAVVRGLRRFSRNTEKHAWLTRHAAARLALANLHRPGTPLRITLLSLGTALTLLVACAVIVASLLRMISSTIPEESPALVLYDVLANQQQSVQEISQNYASISNIALSPIVRGRVASINGTEIRDLAFDDIDWQDMARDEHKLSYLSGNIDGIRMVEGSLWDENSIADTLSKSGLDFAFVMEDREAEQMRLKPGDQVSFSITGEERTGLLTGIYSQRGIQTRFWFEAIFSDGALDPFINTYVGTVYANDEEALAYQTALARQHPNIITVRTKELVDSASELLGKATKGLAVLSSISLFVSLMVLASVMAAGRKKQRYDSIILYCIGARLSYIRKAIRIEYALLAIVVSVFSIALGLGIAALVLQVQLKIYELDVYWYGAILAFAASTLVFSIGAQYLSHGLKLQPAQLLKDGA